MRSLVGKGVESAYVAVVAGLAVLGAVREEAAFYLVAIAVTLPLGVAAVVAVYAGYALIAAAGGLWASSTAADGNEAAWLSTGSAALDIAVLCGAALGNVLLLKQLRRRRRRQRAGI